MNEYTYENIIFDPSSKEAKNCIGKAVYSADNPTICLDAANSSIDCFCGILDEIKEGYFPFVIRKDNTETNWSHIILKKEESNG